LLICDTQCTYVPLGKQEVEAALSGDHEAANPDLLAWLHGGVVICRVRSVDNIPHTPKLQGGFGKDKLCVESVTPNLASAVAQAVTARTAR
jgi:hypothetical protein